MLSPDILDCLKRHDYAGVLAGLAGVATAAFTPRHYLAGGLALGALDRWPEAYRTFADGCARHPDDAALWAGLAQAARQCGLTAEALTGYERALRLDPGRAEIAANLSALHLGMGDAAAAERMARRALALGVAPAGGLNNLALALQRQGRFAKAAAAFAEAIALSPHDAVLHANLANLHADAGAIDAALTAFARARRLDDRPVFRRDEGIARLLAGDHAAGWPLYEARLDLPRALRLHPACPRWRGESLRGRCLLIHAEQGFGDTIQFSRYDAALPDGDLVWAVQPSLVRLLQPRLRGAVLDETGALPACDFHLPMMSLPCATGAMDPGRYAPPGRIAPAPGDGRRRIGIVWAGSPTHERDRDRSIPAGDLIRALAPLDADLYGVTPCPLPPDLRAAGVKPSPALEDFAGTAAFLGTLDTVVTVDTAVAHLAGMLGLPAFVLLPFCPDWRWGLRGDTTPWYSSLRLLRQDAFGDWTGVLARLPGLLLECGF